MPVVARVALLLAVAACSRPAQPPPTVVANGGPLPPRTELSCGSDGPSSVASGPDVPSVVLYERDPWLSLVGSDAPTVALWDTGEILFIHEVGKRAVLWQAKIDPTTAHELAANVARWTATVPLNSSVSEWTDATTVELVVRDGNHWRSTSVYGLTRDGAPTPVEVGSDLELVEHPENRPVVPGELMRAYRELLKTRPTTGTAFQPADLEVVFWGFDYAHGPAVPWPDSVPAPPRDKVPAGDLGDPTSYSFVVPAGYLGALQAMNREAQASKPPRGIGFNGHKWTVSVVERFRGQETIDAVIRCAHAESRATDKSVRTTPSP